MKRPRKPVRLRSRRLEPFEIREWYWKSYRREQQGDPFWSRIQGALIATPFLLAIAGIWKLIGCIADWFHR